MPARRSFRRRVRYKFDTILARGTVAVILWLFLITAAVVVVTGTLLSVLDIAVHGHHVGIIEGIWQNMLRSFEPAAMEADTGWPLRLQSLLVVVFGILVVSSLIGLIASGIDRRVDELRKGRSEVLQSGHVLILGWSEKIFPIISELVLAHRHRRDSVIVIMADHDKIEMEDEIRARVRNLGRTRVVVRRGDPSSPADVALVAPYESRSVIALGNNHMDGDAQVIRSVLALMDDDRFTDLRVVADCAMPENADALRDATDATPSPSPPPISSPGWPPRPAGTRGSALSSRKCSTSVGSTSTSTTTPPSSGAGSVTSSCPTRWRRPSVSGIPTASST